MERKPDWDHWNACETLAVWEAVSLSIGREPASVPDRSRKLVNPSTYRPRNLFDGGPEYERRLDLLRRAFEVDPTRFTLRNDYYGAFSLFEKRTVLPSKVRQFFIDKGLAIPAAWAAPTATEAPVQPEAQPQPSPQPTEERWKLRARELFGEMAAGSSLSKPQLADKIAERLDKDGIRGRGEKRLTGATVLRHALQNIPKP